MKPGFYWVKERAGGRWEVAEFDGVAWNIGPEIYIIGPMIPESTQRLTSESLNSGVYRWLLMVVTPPMLIEWARNLHKPGEVQFVKSG